jgi:hypothetical protein
MTKILALAAVLLAGILSAYAQIPANFYPPSEFDRPFAGSLFIAEEIEQQALLEACSMVGQAKHGLNGCAQVPNTHGLKSDECVILLAQKSFLDRYGVELEDLKRHEVAHCNGWRHRMVITKPPPLPMEKPKIAENRKPDEKRKVAETPRVAKPKVAERKSEPPRQPVNWPVMAVSVVLWAPVYAIAAFTRR